MNNAGMGNKQKKTCPQNPKGTGNFGQVPSEARLGRQWRPVASSNPCIPCSHLCRRVDILLPGRGVHGEKLFVHRHCTQNEWFKVASMVKTLVTSADGEL